jgi:DNA-binding transcriptional LysR family regulator
MNQFDLNLLTALKVLVEEESVEKAARKLHLSPSAMSRTLGRIRAVFGDEILVRAGKRMVATTKAKSLQDSLGRILLDIDALAGAASERGILDRTISISANDGFIDSFAVAIIAEFFQAWPHVKLRFSPKHEKDVTALRDGNIDLEIGVLGGTGPEIVRRKLFEDRMVGVCRLDHPLSQGRITLDRYLSFPHISVSRKGLFHGPVDDVLAEQGRARNVISVVPNIHSSLELAGSSDWIALVPEKHTIRPRKDLFTFRLPVVTPLLTISMMWHPRLDGDLVHQHLRDLIVRACRRDTVHHPPGHRR